MRASMSSRSSSASDDQHDRALASRSPDEPATVLQTISGRLPEHLHPQLHLPRVVGGGNRPECRRAAVAGRREEVHAVEEIERLDAELELRASADRNVLAPREIELPEARPAHVIARRVAERLARIGRKR